MFGSYEQFFSYKNSLNVFTWTILSTLDSRAANNFSLIFFFFFISIFNAKHATRICFTRKIFIFISIYRRKANYSGNQHSNFSILSEKKKKLRQKPERLLYEWLTSWWVCTQSNEKKKKVLIVICVEKRYYSIFCLLNGRSSIK